MLILLTIIVLYTQRRTNGCDRAPFFWQASMLLDHTPPVPLHRQIYLRLRRAILDEQLPPEQKLPSTRTFASELGVSWNTVSTAYEQLQAEGYIERTVGSGTNVARFFPAVPTSTLAPQQAPASAAPLMLSSLGNVVAECAWFHYSA